MSKMITVGISDLNVAQNGDSLITYALGSCIGICIFDTVRKIAGMSHIMLPTAVGFDASGRAAYKFADTAIVQLIAKMEALGAKKICMKAKIAGGAQMFAISGNSALGNIGERNSIAVKQELRRLGIQIIAEDCGKNYGRTQTFSSVDGSMTIKPVNGQVLVL